MDQRKKKRNMWRREDKEQFMVTKRYNWSELCPDLVRSVFERLSFTEFNRAKSVCSSWNSASKLCVPKKNQTPWLILFPRSSSNESNSSCVLFCPEDKDNSYKTRDLGVDFIQSRCLATYSSWLLMMDEQWNLNILNPFTGERIDLPLTESEMPKKDREELMKSSIACMWVDKKTKDYLVVWRMKMKRSLVFTKKGNNEWRRITPKHFSEWAESYEQMVHDHKAQKLYVYRKGYAVKIWCFNGHDDPQEVDGSGYPFTVGFVPRDFFMVGEEEEDLFWKEFVDGWVNFAITISGQVLKIASVVQRSKRWLFRIFKRGDWKWVQIDSLGDEALILDMGITVVAKDIPGIKRNSIYVSGVGYGRNDPEHIFVYDLTTHEVERLPQFVFSSINFSDARWFFPGLSD